MMGCYAAWEVQIALLVVNPLVWVHMILLQLYPVELIRIALVEDSVLLV